jgi:hypothetical protein
MIGKLTVCDSCYEEKLADYDDSKAYAFVCKRCREITGITIEDTLSLPEVDDSILEGLRGGWGLRQPE